MFGDIDLDYDDFEEEYKSDNLIATSSSNRNYGQEALEAGD